jgi:hypothetical protein
MTTATKKNSKKIKQTGEFHIQKKISSKMLILIFFPHSKQKIYLKSDRNGNPGLPPMRVMMIHVGVEMRKLKSSKMTVICISILQWRTAIWLHFTAHFDEFSSTHLGVRPSVPPDGCGSLTSEELGESVLQAQ